jgi:hypothetical protein
MHWSASVAQLGAVVVMVGVKAWVRRGRTKTPSYEALASGFELDSFVKTLGSIKREPWSGPRYDGDDISGKKTRSDVPEDSNNWSIVTGGKSSFDQSRSSSPVSQTLRDFDAQIVLNARTQLGRLCNWRSTASSEAISLARAI